MHRLQKIRNKSLDWIRTGNKIVLKSHRKSYIFKDMFDFQPSTMYPKMMDYKSIIMSIKCLIFKHLLYTVHENAWPPFYGLVLSLIHVSSKIKTVNKFGDALFIKTARLRLPHWLILHPWFRLRNNCCLPHKCRFPKYYLTDWH